MVHATLPHRLSAEDLAKRNAELTKKQEVYTYESPPTLPGLAFIKGPVDKLEDEMPSFWWGLSLGIAEAKILLNFSNLNPARMLHAVRVIWDAVFVDQKDSKKVDDLIKKIDDAKDTEALANQALKRFNIANIRSSSFEEKNPILEPYRRMYQLLDEPDIADIFLEDRVFTRLRVAGYNPMSLFRVRDLDAMPFAIDEAMMPNAGDTIEAAIAEKRLYALGFSFLEDIKPKQNSEMIYVATKSLFVIPPRGGDLQAVAIQLPDRVVYPPRSCSRNDTRWAIAKMAVNNGDAVHHELVAHLGNTHLLLEPFVAATMRQLPSTHPVHVLLKPHFEGTVFINDSAANNLVAPGGNVDKNFAGEIESLMGWAAEQVLARKFNKSMPLVEMELRGVDHNILRFPYREDATAHYYALRNWVNDFLSYYYNSDEDVVADFELKNWAEELSDPKRGRILDFGDYGTGEIFSVDYLVSAVTFVIFSASVQHAAVNFPQNTLMSYAPAVSGALWAQLPKHDAPSDVDKWASMLTPIKVAIEQVQILGLLGNVYYTRLGHYRHREIPKDEPIQKALRKYRDELRKIDQAIRNREENEELKYEYMRPENIPQSINI